MRTRRLRVAEVLAVTFAGLVVGVLSDVAISGTMVSFRDAALAVLFSPLLAVVGSPVVSRQPAVFVVVGLLFWPVWLLLVRNHVQARTPAWHLALLGAWSVQGFFMLVTRFEWMMSV